MLLDLLSHRPTMALITSKAPLTKINNVDPDQHRHTDGVPIPAALTA
jgi:hypothetical protein